MNDSILTYHGPCLMAASCVARPALY